MSKTTDIRTLITAVIKQDIKADTTSTALFVGALKYFKGCVSYKSTMQGLVEILTTVGDETKATKAFIQRVKGVLSNASKADEYGLHTIDSKVVMNSTKLYYYNISKAINLLDHLRQTDSGSVNKVKNRLNKVKKVADKRIYNDTYSKELQDLYKEYKVVLTDEGNVIKIEMTEKGLLELIGKLTPELRAFVQANTAKEKVA